MSSLSADGDGGGDGDCGDMMHNELSNHIEHAGATVVSSLSQDWSGEALYHNELPGVLIILRNVTRIFINKISNF